MKRLILLMVLVMAVHCYGAYSRGFTMSNEIQLTEQQAFQQADVVVTGFIERIAQGREFNDSRSIIASPVNTAIVKLRVSSAMKGTPGRYVYIEHVTGGISTEVLDAAKTAGELQVYTTLVDGARLSEELRRRVPSDAVRSNVDP